MAQPTCEVFDDLSLKKEEMRNTVILVSTNYGRGSGVIIEQLETEEEGTYEYLAVTNNHVTERRFGRVLRGADIFRGKFKFSKIDNGCNVVVFDNQKRECETIEAIVIAEDEDLDLALISFKSKEQLPVAKIATSAMLDDIQVFDDVFAVGCQLGSRPIPTDGIISRISMIGDEKELITYGNTAQISPGSSGGGLFKKYDDHYYLIGIQYRVSIAPNGQFVPHLASAISFVTAQKFIDDNAVSIPDE